MDRLAQDLRYAVRRLLLSRAFTATAVGTLAAGPVEAGVLPVAAVSVR